ncbi:MAG TPA: SDR family NAD(P)-dependent oxidoreductase [Polyangiaceae bacterium]|nr:SDR family NAD(P)-dependent oxidoreductase [Polyangiaceae bacterium]
MSAPRTPRPVALVTGSNRGIGLEIARQLGRLEMTVVVAARDAARGEAAAAALRGEGLDAVATRLDVTDGASIEAAARFVRERFGRLDVLVNNAGAAFDWTAETTQPSAVDADTLRRTFETNVFGPLALAQALLPLLRESPRGRIVNVSSKIGSIDEIGRPDSPLASMVAPAYQASKAALNAFTALLAKELRGTRVKVNSACPGWVDTDGGVPPWLRAALGGNGGAVPVEQGADTPVWLATLPDDGPSGGFFQGRKPVAW